jgi:hypothetical protein
MNKGLGLRFQGLRFRIKLRGKGSGFRVKGLGFKV